MPASQPQAAPRRATTPSRKRRSAAVVAERTPLAHAPCETSIAAQPFLKWAGGKRALLSVLRDHVPQDFATYHEPFIGGGAFFFDLRPQRAVLCDANERLVRTWRCVRDDVEALIERLAAHERRHAPNYFYAQRQRAIDAESDVELAAWLIYLNKTAFNGLYRVNRNNGFNVPLGRYSSPRICDPERLRACARALADATVETHDFGAILDRAQPNDFVYFDPPYVPASASANFTAYSHEPFGLEQHVRLRDTALALKRRGVHVLLSNSWNDTVRELYADGFKMRRVQAPRAINSKGSARGCVDEALIW